MGITANYLKMREEVLITLALKALMGSFQVNTQRSLNSHNLFFHDFYTYEYFGFVRMRGEVHGLRKKKRNEGKLHDISI
jgi:hypothetical protein